MKVKLLLLIAMVLLSGCFENKNKKKIAPPGVLVEKIHYKDIESSVQYAGHTTAVNDVSLQAQVSGYLLAIHFTEGTDVAVGQELFTIDPDLYLAGVAAAEGTLAKAEADLVRAEKDLVRYRILLKEKNISRQQFDITQSEVLQNKAQVKYAQAGVQAAQLDLSHTHILSPINGRIGQILVSKGNVIGSQTKSLARIVELDPIYVTFNVAEADLVEVKQLKLKGKADANTPGSHLKIRLILPDKSEYQYQGKLDFVDNAIDAKTGTVIVRAKFANPDKLLVPGMYVKTVIARSKQKSKLLVHASAVQEDQAGRFVMVVDADNKVEMRRISTGKQVAGSLVIKEGLQVGEQVVVEGIQKIRPGMLVAPKIAVLPGDEKSRTGNDENKLPQNKRT